VRSAPLYLSAVAVAGLGYGIAFTGALRAVPAAVGVHERAGLFAAMYTVSYLAFGLPAVAAGFLIPVLTLGGTTQWYGLAVIAGCGCRGTPAAQTDHAPAARPCVGPVS